MMFNLPQREKEPIWVRKDLATKIKELRKFWTLFAIEYEFPDDAVVVDEPLLRPVRHAARERFDAISNDQVLLAEIAKNHPNWRARKIAVENLTDQAALAEVAKVDIWVGLEAVEKLTDQALLAEVAKSKPSNWMVGAVIKARVRVIAVKKINDKALLEDIINNTAQWLWDDNIIDAAKKRLEELKSKE